MPPPQDTSVSVRKRVIKIFRDICLQLENFPKRSDVYGKILRRISDEEAVQVQYIQLEHIQTRWAIV